MKEGRDCIIAPNIRWRYPDKVILGDSCILDDWLYISAALHLGTRVHISAHVTILGGGVLVDIGDYVDIGPGVLICSASTDYTSCRLSGPAIPQEIAAMSIRDPVYIERGAVIGAHSIILPGSRIPEGCAIGAMSLVSHEVPLEPWSLFAGIPARFIRHRSNLQEYKNQLERLENV